MSAQQCALKSESVIEGRLIKNLIVLNVETLTTLLRFQTDESLVGYALICIAFSKTHEDIEADELVANRREIVEKAIHSNRNFNGVVMTTKNIHELVVFADYCDAKSAEQNARIIRQQISRDPLTSKPVIMALSVESDDVDAKQMLNYLRRTFDRAIKSESSRVILHTYSSEQMADNTFRVGQ